METGVPASSCVYFSQKQDVGPKATAIMSGVFIVFVLKLNNVTKINGMQRFFFKIGTFRWVKRCNC